MEKNIKKARWTIPVQNQAAALDQSNSATSKRRGNCFQGDITISITAVETDFPVWAEGKV